MKLWYAVFWVSAWGFAVGVALFLTDFFTLARAGKETAPSFAEVRVEQGR